MTHQTGDEDLERLFAALRGRDRRVEPPAFSALLDAAELRAGPIARRQTWTPLRVAAAIGFLLVGGGAVALVRHFAAAPAEEIAISSWRSPTEFLLRVPGEEILRTVPNPSASVVALP